MIEVDTFHIRLSRRSIFALHVLRVINIAVSLHALYCTALARLRGYTYGVHEFRIIIIDIEEERMAATKLEDKSIWEDGEVKLTA